MGAKSLVAKAVVCAVLVFAATSSAQTIELAASADTFLKNGSPNQNQGSDPYLRVQSSGKNRALVRFDPAEIASAVGSGSLAAARLELFVEGNPSNWGSTGRTIDAHRLLADWSELGATWNCGIDAAPGNSKADCELQWDGGVYAEEPTDTYLQLNGLSGWVSFDVTADARAFLDGSPDFGWLVKKTEEGQSGQIDYTSVQGIPGQEPRLILIVESAAFDEVPPVLAIAAPTSDVIVNDLTPEIRVTYSDGGTGVDLSSLQVRVGATDVSASCTVGTSAAVCESSSLTAGVHAVFASISDFAGNTSSAAHGFELLAGPGLQTIAFLPVADSYLRSGSPNQNHGAESLLRVRSSGHNRALVRFDEAAIAAALDGATLHSAYLELTVTKNGDNWGASGRSVDAHRITVPWSELGATWNCADDLDPSNQQADCGATWGGGSYAAGATASVVHTKGMTGTVGYDVSVDVATLLGGGPHHGWILRKTEEGQSGLVEYGSRESATPPRLVVVFEVPVTESELPPDPATIAPAYDAASAVDLLGASSFLWTSEDPVQTGVVAGAILPERISLLRGRVLGPGGVPLPGVRVSAHGSPDTGETLSRTDGVFDLAVNGGGRVTVVYEKEAYLPAYRSIELPANDWGDLDDVVLIQVDPVVTPITPGLTEMQVARGSVVTDADGTRQATLMFPGGFEASMVLPGGSTAPLSALSVRATEYTVGPLGPLQMPAELPENTGYTYAVEYSIDEAVAAGATAVEFSEPVVSYVDNFLDFPVGEPVPVGFYDRQRAVWVAEPNGLVVGIVGISGSLAELDLTGDGQAADAAELAELGITDAERIRLAALYPVGATLWRAPLSHFSPCDYNWPYGPPPDAEPPPAFEPEPTDPNTPPDENLPEGDDSPPYFPDPEVECGSILDCTNQELRERIPLVGVPFSLNYSTDRIAKRAASTTVSVPVTGDSVPEGLRRVEVKTSITGYSWGVQVLAPAPNQKVTFSWPQLDRWLREYPLDAPVRMEVCHIYQPVYYSTRSGFDNAFSRVAASGFEFTSVRLRNASEIRICRTQSQALGRLTRPALGAWDASSSGLGYWTLDAHHRYNPVTGALYLGDGRRRLVRPFDTYISRFAGTGGFGYSGDGGPARQAEIGYITDIAFGPDGSVYLADVDEQRIRRVDRDGTISTVAGDGSDCFDYGCGDGGQATSAQLSAPFSVTVASDGSLLIGDDGCIRAVAPSGVISTIHGDCYMGPNRLSAPEDILRGPGGGLYIADSDWNQIFYLGTDGLLDPIAGNTSCSGALGATALESSICSPGGLAFDSDGQLLIAGGYSERIFRLRRDGTLETIAGTGSSGLSGDGGPATSARLSAPRGIAALPDGSFLVADTFNGLVRRVSQHGLIGSLAGGWSGDDLVDGMHPERAFVGFAEKVAVAPDGRIYLSDSWDARILVIGDAGPIVRNDEYLIPSERGDRVFVFDRRGLHLRTLHALTGATLLDFQYDAGGRLSSIVDFDGNTTSIERDGSGAPIAIVGPYSQRTELALNGSGALATVTNPADESYSLEYEGGLPLLSSIRDPRSNATTFGYNHLDKLERESDPAGGVKTLFTGSSGEGESRVRVQTAEGRNTIYENRLDGEARAAWKRLYVSPTDQVETRQVLERDGSRVVHRPDGSSVATTEFTDPVWGALVRYSDSVVVNTPGNLGPTVSRVETATLANESEPLSLLSRRSDVRVNNRLYRVDFDRDQLRWTFTTPAGRTSTVEIDAAGRPVSSQVGDLEPVFYDYDERGRLASIVQGSGAEQRSVGFAYDGLGRLATATDPLLRSATFDYDAANRVVEQELPGDRAVLYDWEDGNLASLTPPGKPAHLFDYTPVDLVQRYEPPDVGIGNVATDYEWNRDRNAERILRPDGSTIDFGYDLGLRPTSITSPRGTQTLAWEPNKNRIQRTTTPEGVALDYLYNGPLVTRTTWSGAGISGRVDRTYDDDLRLKTISVNGANPITYTYDADSLVKQAGSLVLNRDPETGLLMSTTLGNVTTSYSYSGFGELATMEARFGATLLYSEVYTRDFLGRIVARIETIQGVTTTYEYGYDSAGRLEFVKKNGSLASHYTYDANGNRLLKWTQASNEVGTYDAQDRVLTYAGASYSYAANGETLSISDSSGTTSYQYDGFGSLVGADFANGTQVRYKVDGRNRRIERRINGVVTHRWLWQGQLSPIAELNASNAVVSRFVYATRVNVPEFIIRSGNTYRLLTDHLGSPRLIVNVANGSIVQRLDFDEWGISSADSNPEFQPFGFAGGIPDRLTELIRFGARDYSSFEGRWSTTDPLGFRGGSGNLYVYSRNDSLNNADVTGRYSPEGHFSITLFAARGAGFGWNEALKLAYDTAAADWTPTWDESQAVENAHWHAMCPPGVAKTECEDRFRQLVEEGQLGDCEPASLAQRLHALQDSFAPGHAGFQTYTGDMSDLIPEHAAGDWNPSDPGRALAAVATQQFLMNYAASGGGNGGW